MSNPGTPLSSPRLNLMSYTSPRTQTDAAQQQPTTMVATSDNPYAGEMFLADKGRELSRTDSTHTYRPIAPTDYGSIDIRSFNTAEELPRLHTSVLSDPFFKRNAFKATLFFTVLSSGLTAAAGAAGAAFLSTVGCFVLTPAIGAALGAVGGPLALLVVLLVLEGIARAREEFPPNLDSSEDPSQLKRNFLDIAKAVALGSAFVGCAALTSFVLFVPTGAFAVSVLGACAALGTGTALILGLPVLGVLIYRNRQPKHTSLSEIYRYASERDQRKEVWEARQKAKAQ